MKIALIGYGKMGRMIDSIAVQRGHEVVARIDPSIGAAFVNPAAMEQVDVCIDFSKPSSAIDNLKMVAKHKKNLIMGTTGWYDKIDQAKAIVAEHNIGFLYAPNFSLGVNLFLKIVNQAIEIMNTYEEYDIAGFEAHHNQKLDAPSGTAKDILELLDKKLTRKDKEKTTFSSLRCGSIPGTHSLIFDSPVDTITLTHQARNREGFARGSLMAAEWLKGKTGFYTMADMV